MSPVPRVSIRYRPRTFVSSLGLAALGLVLLSTQASAQGWYSPNWQYRRSITVDRTNVSGTVTNFPMLVFLGSDGDLAADARDDGFDILFTSSDGTSKLSHQIEKFDGGTGELAAWVKMPGLSSAADSVIYMYYGYASAPDQQDVSNVWDVNYKGVWHLHDDFLDATGNANGTNQGSTDTTGKIADGQSFDGVNDDISLGTGCLVLSSWTVEFWVKPNSPGNYERIFIQGASGCASRQIMLYWHTDHIEIRTSTGSAGNPQAASLSITNGVWTHLTWTSTATTGTLYRNGQSGLGTITGGNVGVDGANFIGARNGGNYWTGDLDEVRVSNLVRSANWVQTSYNNQNSPGSFITLGSEQVIDTSTPAAVTDLATGVVTSSSVVLSWTAPGDDGSAGTASSYDVRYSTSTITEANWASATQASGEPSPQVAGSAESFTVTGLSSGTTYYFAIKTSDEIPNESALSNVPSAATIGDIVTQTGYAWSEDVTSFTSKGDDVPLDMLIGTTYVLGIQVSMTLGAASGDWVLQVREDGAGSWLNVFALGAGDSPVWETDATHTFSKSNGVVVTTAEFGNGTAPAGFTAVDGEFSDDNNGLTDGYAGTDIYTELQYTVRAQAAAAGHWYEFRVLYNGTVLNAYDVYALTETYAVSVTPDGSDTLSVLPSNGTPSSYAFSVTNNSNATEEFDLLGFPGDTLATFLTVDSITGPNVTGAPAVPDSARMASVAVSGSDNAFVWYSVANVAAGTLDSLYLEGRSVTDNSVSDSGWVFVQVIKPNVATAKAVNPSGTQLPGTNLTYTVTITNDGSDDAVNLVIIDSLAVEVQFQVSSIVNNLPSGITVTVEYSNDGGSTWTYTPVSTGCAAPAGYDACVTHIRWSLQNDLSHVAPDNTGNVEFGARIK